MYTNDIDKSDYISKYFPYVFLKSDNSNDPLII